MTSERGRFYCQSRDFPPPMEQQCRVLERPVGLGQRGDAPALWTRHERRTAELGPGHPLALSAFAAVPGSARFAIGVAAMRALVTTPHRDLSRGASIATLFRVPFPGPPSKGIGHRANALAGSWPIGIALCLLSQRCYHKPNFHKGDTMTKKIWLAVTAAAFLLELTATSVAGAQTTSQSIFVYVQGAFGGNQPTASVVVAGGASTPWVPTSTHRASPETPPMWTATPLSSPTGRSPLWSPSKSTK